MKERYEDALERIRLIPAERTTAEPFCSFFRDTAEYILAMDEWYRRFAEEDILTTGDIAGLREMNAALYGPLLPGERMAEWLGAMVSAGLDRPSGHAGVRQPSCREARMTELSPLCSGILRELTALIPAVYEKREERIIAALELFIQVYCLFEDAGEEIPREKTVHDAFYSYFYDYSEEMQEEVLRDHFDPRDSYLQRFMLTADTSSADYLYRSGEYVSQAQLQRFEDTQVLSEMTVQAQLKAWREQPGICGVFPRLQRGEAEGRRPYVLLQAVPGRERLYQALARSLQDEGIDMTMPRAARGILMGVPEKRSGYYESPNLRTDWLHDYDLALLMGDRLTSRLLEERRHLLTALSREGNVCIGVVQDALQTSAPAGEEKEEAARLRFTEHQDTVYKDYCRKAEALTRAALMENEIAEEAEHETTL